MKKLFRYCVALASLTWLTGQFAFAAGNIQKGRALAEERCVNCHIVDRAVPNAIESQPVGPDFATMKKVDGAKLGSRLKNSHPIMSKFPELSGQQISDLAAYINSVSR